MNLLHLKYAVEVAKAGSINKAAEALLIAQPNLSRSIKELEADLGVTIFERSSKGMTLTLQGEEFIGYANNILSQIDSVECMYKKGIPMKRHFSVSVPRATYISEAFARFVKGISRDSAEIFYKETNSSRTIKNILYENYRLGIVRFASVYEDRYRALFEEKGFADELIAEFRYVLVMRSDSPLTKLKEIRLSDLTELIEIAHDDPYVPSLPASAVKREELPDNIRRRVFVFERASRFDLLSENPQTFMWVSPIPRKTLDRFGLVQLPCADNRKTYRDVLIYKKDYKLTEMDRSFIAEVCQSKRRNL